MDKYWIGIDTGGTFTDLVLRDTDSSTCVYHKVPTRTQDPAQGILDGIRELLEISRVAPAHVDFVVLGTTLATNAVLEGTWARTGMLTTQGFGDVLDIARQRRPHYFNLDIPKPVPPSARADRFEVAERLQFDGSVVTGLDEDAVRRAVSSLRESGVGAVAVCFMHAYANPEHEQRALAIVREHWPDAYVCASADVLPELREYERFITTAVNASLMPVMDRYLERFEQGVKDIGVQRPARVMQSNGGAVTTKTVRKLPINTFFSGPAGGVMATVTTGMDVGQRGLIAFDMGGTSTDVCLVKDLSPAMKSERPMRGLPVRAPTFDIHTIGAGGGSLAWLDAGGMLKVGPRSAGAYPGPAAYGRGGTLPTVTDANVVLGRLSPVSLLDGRMDVFPQNAEKAIRETVAEPLGMSVADAAVGILKIATVHMTGAVRVISVEQGEDPREYALVAFGGAGPLHAAEVALSAGMHRVVVPPRPGLLSAQGLLQSDQRGDFAMTCLVAAEPAQIGRVNAGFEALESRMQAWLQDESADAAADVQRTWQIDMRYAGQSSELTLPIEGPVLDAALLDALRARFHQRHEATLGYKLPAHDVQIVNVRGAVVIRSDKPATAAIGNEGSIEAAVSGHRSVWFAQTGFVDTPIIKRDRLYAGAQFTGPAVVEQMDTTTVVPPGARASVDRYGYLHLDLSDILNTQGFQA
ncbi:hydantoinase/oxoprolinase family protein [Bordetella genomosp. 13]|uniref:hydantoinase/oxoprolinase family protein n=1 Tax=Bordetella genomosp. 13 TaxID=463040 RepID=UPI001642D88F|nr:hydantoinase/oxoprolinase family protein [Bordetella genomosp. 13]